MFKSIILFITSTISAWFMSFTGNPQEPPVITPISIEIATSTPELPQIPTYIIKLPVTAPGPQETPNLTQETAVATQTPALQTPPTVYVPIIVPIQPPVGVAPEVQQIPSVTTTQQTMPKPTQSSLKIIQMGGGQQGKFIANDYKINPDGTLASGSTEPNDGNYIDLGLIVRNKDGNAVKDIEVTITATDEKQNKVLKNTGNIRKIYDANGNPETVPYYPFRYEFRTAGQHTITFSANGMVESFKVDVSEPSIN